MPVLSLLTGDTLVPTRPLASTRMQDKPALKHKHDNISIQLSLIGDSIMQRGLSDYMSGIQSAGKVIHKIAMPLGQRVISISRLWLHCSCRVKWIEILFMFLFLDWFPYHLLYGAWFGMCFFFSSSSLLASRLHKVPSYRLFSIQYLQPYSVAS